MVSGSGYETGKFSAFRKLIRCIHMHVEAKLLAIFGRCMEPDRGSNPEIESAKHRHIAGAIRNFWE